jgi:DNA-binding LytR/AlgR family response regulator
MLCEQINTIEVVKAFNNPTAFLAELPHLDFDLCILDIEMPGMNGLQIASLLHNKSVIFTTAYKDYAAEAFDLDAIDYVRKPIQKARLQHAIEKAVKRLEKKTSEKAFVQFNTDKGKAIIFLDQLCYLQRADVDSRDKIAHLSDGARLTLKNVSFEKLQAVLPTNEFCRINKQEMINIRFVQLYTSEKITTTISVGENTFLQFTLSEVYRNDFVKKMRF